jgi:hypothetical protein
VQRSVQGGRKGLTEDKYDELLNFADSDKFTPREKVALTYTSAIVWNSDLADDALWERLHAHFTIPELVESLRVLEGPFDPREGNYAEAGSADYHLGLEQRGLFTKLSAGSYGTKRAFLGYGPPDKSGARTTTRQAGSASTTRTIRCRARMVRDTPSPPRSIHTRATSPSGTRSTRSTARCGSGKTPPAFCSTRRSRSRVHTDSAEI